MGARRSERLLEGAKLFGSFNMNPEYEAELSRQEALNLVTYAGYAMPSQTLQNWIDQRRILVLRDNDGGITSIKGRDVFNLCNAHRSRQVEKALIRETTTTSIQVNLRSDIKELFIKMAQSQNVTLTQLLSDHLTKLGEEKLEEINQRVQAELQMLKNKYIDQVTL